MSVKAKVVLVVEWAWDMVAEAAMAVVGAVAGAAVVVEDVVGVVVGDN
jgi:hypothetical protein